MGPSLCRNFYSAPLSEWLAGPPVLEVAANPVGVFVANFAVVPFAVEVVANFAVAHVAVEAVASFVEEGVVASALLQAVEWALVVDLLPVVYELEQSVLACWLTVHLLERK